MPAATLWPDMQTETDPAPSGVRPGWRSDWRSGLRDAGPIFGLVAIAIAVSFIVRHEIYPAFSVNRDEPIYLWQAQALRSGHFFTSDGGAPSFFQPWLTGHADAGFFSQYTLGWPVLLAAAGIVFGSPGLALAFAAALAVVGVYLLAREITKDRTIAIVAAAVMTLSPIMVIQSGLFLAYIFTVGLGSLFGAALLAGVRTRRPWLLVAAGLLLGSIFITRPYDAILWALPFVGYLVMLHRREWRRLVGPAAWGALGFAPLLLVTLAYNRHITGSFTSFPITAADPLDKFGFGIRRIMPKWTPVDFTIARAFRGTARNLFFLPQFLLGSFVALALALGATWFGRRRPTTWLLLALIVVWPIGYFVFWGIYLSGAKASLSGPLYYIPIYAPLAILIAIALTAIWRRRPAYGIAVVVAMVLATAPFLVQKLDANRETSVAQARWRASAATIPDHSLVFVEPSGPYLVQLNPFSVNPTDLDGRLLYAADRGPDNLTLLEHRPGRVPFLQTKLPVPDGSGSPSTITVTKLHVVHASTIAFHVRITNPTSEPAVVTYAQIAGTTVTRTLDTSSRRGASYEADWLLRGAGLQGDGSNEITAPQGDFTIAIGFGTGSSGDDALAKRRVEQQFGGRTTDAPGATTIEVITPGRGAAQRVTPRLVISKRVDTHGQLTVVATPRA